MNGKAAAIKLWQQHKKVIKGQWIGIFQIQQQLDGTWKMSVFHNR